MTINQKSSNPSLEIITHLQCDVGDIFWIPLDLSFPTGTVSVVSFSPLPKHIQNDFPSAHGTLLIEARVAKVLRYQPASTRPWNAQQIASFAILLALPTLRGKKKKNLPTRIQGFWGEEIFEKNLGWWAAKKRQEERNTSIYVCAENRKGGKRRVSKIPLLWSQPSVTPYSSADWKRQGDSPSCVPLCQCWIMHPYATLTQASPGSNPTTIQVILSRACHFFFSARYSPKGGKKKTTTSNLQDQKLWK